LPLFLYFPNYSFYHPHSYDINGKHLANTVYST